MAPADGTCTGHGGGGESQSKIDAHGAAPSEPVLAKLEELAQHMRNVESKIDEHREDFSSHAATYTVRTRGLRDKTCHRRGGGRMSATAALSFVLRRVGQRHPH